MRYLFSLGLVALALIFSGVNATAQSASDAAFVNDTLYPATFLLYTQDAQGGMAMACTATAIERDSAGVTFVTAAHCACHDNNDKPTPNRTLFYLTNDSSTQKNFVKATLKGCGSQHRGNDFALFTAPVPASTPIVAVGVDSTSHAGDVIINVAGPDGLGKQTLWGRISAPDLSRPIEQGNISWTDAMLLQIPGTGPGSSGSSVVCLNQKAICGFIVGTIDDNEIVAMPVSRFTHWLSLRSLKPGKLDKSDKLDNKGDE